MGISIGAANRVDYNYPASRIDFNRPIGNRDDNLPRETEKLPDSPAVQDAAGKGRDGRNILFSADGDSAEFYNTTMPTSETPNTTAMRMPEYGIVLFSQDGDTAQFSFRPGDSEDASLPASATPGVKDSEPCETCSNRKYVDGSDDPSVSFKTPTKLNSGNAAAAVAAHENEHVHNERREAEREDRQITHQSVTFHYDTCPECGKQYIAGGTTRTRTVNDHDDEQKLGMEEESGKKPDLPEAS